ncbi:MAG TPA: oligoribonuclease [Idiomarina abyssalis]|jgi:oligoribonuclease|uniref:oligoribonuclease n=1 Tax=Idiomarina TaxID=135575 RepID=UPI000C0A5D6B|nr:MULTISPECIES: oligoribonuclease [Idiomarina]MAL83702.1 oligoribonuclease [Idiomarina sp.]MBH93168.1 oligoribonuclease [Idiomarina sp.]MDA6067941.1 oligoribonuclease [Idiomarina abyssalis]HAS15672.1 oligoribonuclease [Idiomarina abyssalis]|tara:strand:- start:468 stop:1019 length:552 start_codon:yes stop_codon:yes gene_type:complete
MTEDDKKQRLIWIDLEMTGLVPEEHHIIEVATIVTDAQLNTLAEGPVIALHQPQKYLDRMDDWNVKTHTGSGLVERIKQSQYDEKTAAAETIEFLKQYVDAGVSPMCGNSICQDRRFLAKHMPELEAFFHYRNLDVSTLKELAKRWQPEVVNSFKKSGAHEALADIRESIAELQHYREHFFSK